MDDMNAFEREIAREMLRRAGPDPAVDDLAIFNAITTTQSAKWRFQNMFSATKFVVAGAIVALFGGFLLIAQPFDQQGGSVPGAATDIEAAASVEFTARAFHDRISGVGPEPDRFPFIETSDPRIDGTLIWTSTSETYPGVDIEVGAVSSRIENEGGAWQELPAFAIISPPEVAGDGREDGHPTESAGVTPWRTFVGEDGYEGWFVVADLWHYSDLGLELHGFIIEGELPVALEPWSAE